MDLNITEASLCSPISFPSKISFLFVYKFLSFVFLEKISLIFSYMFSPFYSIPSKKCISSLSLFSCPLIFSFLQNFSFSLLAKISISLHSACVFFFVPHLKISYVLPLFISSVNLIMKCTLFLYHEYSHLFV